MTPFSWNNPYAWPRKPLLAQNVVATSQPLAAQAGLQMLAAGGSAVDAILATAITLSLVEPVSNGIGSDAYAHRLGRTQAARPERLGALAGRVDARLLPRQKAMPVRGWDTVTVPGASRPGSRCTRKFGKLPFRKLFEPAIRYGREGFLVSPTIAGQWASQVAELKDQPGFAQAFLPDGRAPRPEKRFKFPETCRRPWKRSPRPRARLLPRRACRKARSGGEEAGRRAARVRHGGAQARLGEAARDGLPRLHAARDPAQRPGHRRADGARHARALRPALASGRRRRQRAPADRGGEARLRRCAGATSPTSTTWTCARSAARQGIPEVEVEAHRSRSARRISATASRRKAARCTSPRPTPPA